MLPTNGATGKPSPVLRMSLMASTAFASMLLAGEAAQAACDPKADSGVTATCTGTTVNQGTGAPGSSGGNIGYGDPGLTNIDVTVVSGASVTGTDGGIHFDAGHVTNSGRITGTSQSGIRANNTANVVNLDGGTITGSHGIYANAIAYVTNSGTVTGTINTGIWGTTTAYVTNSGTVAGALHGIRSVDAVYVTNSGEISGGERGVSGSVAAYVTNSGTITGTTVAGVFGVTANVTNSGTISGNIGIYTVTANVTNSGTITGDIGISADRTVNVTNSGTISGGSGTAMVFNANGTAASDNLTILPGARFGGLVDFGGGADRVTFGPGSWVLHTANFDSAQSTVVTAGQPYVVEPNRIVVADVSGFAAMNRALMDITGWIASVLPDVPVVGPERTPNRVADAFSALDQTGGFGGSQIGSADLPATANAYAPVFKAGAVSDAYGNNVWAKSFGGRRAQPTDGNIIGSVTSGFGGAFGYERLLGAGLAIGGFVGASSNRTDQQLNAGRIDTDAAFAGLYARASYGASFLDLALIGGALDNKSRRNIGGGLAPETAEASYRGWFVNPSLALGHRYTLDEITTLTPALKLRYVAAHFNGYTETGSSANLAVAGRDVQTLEERAELTLAKVYRLGSEQRLVTRLSGGVLAQQRVGDSSVNVALAGQNFIAATPERSSVVGGYAGIGLDWQAGRTILFASGEAIALDDSTTSFAGKGGLRVLW